MSYYIPKTKVELINWLSKYYLTNISKFNYMNKKQLYAIFYKTRKKIYNKE